MEPVTFARPKLVVSRCFESVPCCYHGTAVNNELVSKLSSHADFTPVCPEVDMGLPTPRPPILLVQGDNKTLVLAAATGADITDAAEQFCRSFLGAIQAVDGFLLKARCPSCGVGTTHMYGKDGIKVAQLGDGFFAQFIKRTFPMLPVADEELLMHPYTKRDFLTRIFALADLRQTMHRVSSITELEQFHLRYKYLLMAYSPQKQKTLGAYIAHWADRGLENTKQLYAELFVEALLQPPSINAHLNALQHIMGYFKDVLTASEKQEFLRLVNKVSAGQAPLEAAIAELRQMAARFPNTYVQRQAYLWPFPDELA